MNKTKRFLKAWGIPMACCLTAILFFRLILMLGYVPSASMEPTIQKDSYILGIRVFGELRRSDIIIFNRNGRTMVKRIAALPGETVYIDDVAHAVLREAPKDSNIRRLNVPDSCYFVLGDNQTDSYDSRYWEDPFVQKKDIFAILFA